MEALPAAKAPTLLWKAQDIRSHVRRVMRNPMPDGGDVPADQTLTVMQSKVGRFSVSSFRAPDGFNPQGESSGVDEDCWVSIVEDDLREATLEQAQAAAYSLSPWVIGMDEPWLWCKVDQVIVLARRIPETG